MSSASGYGFGGKGNNEKKERGGSEKSDRSGSGSQNSGAPPSLDDVHIPKIYLKKGVGESQSGKVTLPKSGQPLKSATATNPTIIISMTDEDSPTNATKDVGSATGGASGLPASTRLSSISLAAFDGMAWLHSLTRKASTASRRAPSPVPTSRSPLSDQTPSQQHQHQEDEQTEGAVTLMRFSPTLSTHTISQHDPDEEAPSED
ncbi:hypothetical protein HK102_012580, partial [Quaeritorhiza haematococci]